MIETILKNEDVDIFKKYQSESLFLLIGTNPLPNYVAFHLLAKPTSHIYFVHTNETNSIADRLVNVLRIPDDQWTKILVDESNAYDIYNKINQYAKNKQKLGLNYTGGTKSMAVHSYRAIRDADINAMFSYLDARRLAMLIDSQSTSPIRLSAALSITPLIETLLALHGYTPKDITKEPNHPELCCNLAKVPTDFRQWCDMNLRSGPDSSIRKKNELKNIYLPSSPPYDTLATHWNNCKTLDELASEWGWEIKHLAKWLDGKWLEHYTLWTLQQVAHESKIHDAVLELTINERDFELDVAALRGYQLFAISCTTDSRKGIVKQKLFEAYVRGRQLGGDEARIGIVCFASESDPKSNPVVIRKEIEEEWDAKGRFRVFGAEHLTNLSENFQEWFNSS